MMSRWRETLCGSVIKSAQEGAPELVGGAMPGMLSCGGTFHPYQQKPALLLQRQSGVIFLPKDNYEVLIPGAGNDWVHYNIQIAQQKEDVEMLEEAIKQIDLDKTHK